ncbi:MAG: type II toxin-antitoxin system VapC family toxin [Myxococcales bacterium]|nr:type II toxin-antitoxin system VapC family toxin [Myxococcales bacterium]MDP3505783.1 type II toxin-antitoxin system VapC family toxin [Myxococcales bacterium]
MKRFSLDTNIVADLIRNPAGLVARRLREVGEESVALSIVVAGELRFGAAKSGSARLGRRVEELLGSFEVLPLTTPVDKTYALARRALETAGTPIGPNDLLIAAQAKVLGMTVVTDNLREFDRVPGLEVVNWLR